MKRLFVILVSVLTVVNCGQQNNNRYHTFEPEMVFVQGGTFTMGCTEEQGEDCYEHESPLHIVSVSSFYVGKYEITQGQWETIMGSNPSGFSQGDNFPVENVSWDDVQEFIRRLNAATGKNYRLPTEAEWEYAARGGKQTKKYRYSGSNNLNDVAWFEDNSDSSTNPVGTKMPNELGIYDMSGNVREWCSDWYDTYAATTQRDPVGATSGSFRVIRGGSWYGYDTKQVCRVACRDCNLPEVRYNFIGFRLAHP